MGSLYQLRRRDWQQAGSGNNMKQRSALAATLLSLFIPFYILYWLYDTGRHMAAKGVKVPSIYLLLAPLLMLIPIWVVIFSATAGGIDESSGSPIMAIFPVALLAAVVLSFYYYYKFSEAAEQATNKALTKGLLFILFMFVSPAAVFLIQDKLNSQGESPTGPMSPTAGSPAAPKAPTPPE
jgi:hypothetical protein